MQTSPKTKLTPKTQLTPKTTLTPKKKATPEAELTPKKKATPKTTLTPKKKTTPEKKAAPESSSVCPDAMPQVGRDDASQAAMCLQELPAAIRDYVGIGRYRSADPAILKQKMIKVWFCCCGADPAFQMIPASELTESQIVGVRLVPPILLPEHEQRFATLASEIRAVTYRLQMGAKPWPRDLDHLEWLASEVERMGAGNKGQQVAEGPDAVGEQVSGGLDDDWIPVRAIEDDQLRRRVLLAAEGKTPRKALACREIAGNKCVRVSEVVVCFTEKIRSIMDDPRGRPLPGIVIERMRKHGLASAG